jgi:membrane-bound metal-dependent hydrolase YbcI (DUF457 family)
MPVIGHALAGLAVASWGQASGRIVKPDAFGRRVLLLVALAYIPDFTAQLGVLAGFRGASVVTHSLFYAAAVSLLLAPLVTRVSRLSFRHAVALIAFSLVLHDGMDILQSPRRVPLWPIPLVVNVGRWIPSTLQGELLVCLPLLAAAIVYQWWWWRRGFHIPSGRDWVSVSVVAATVLVAMAASEVRDSRERALIRARALAESGEFNAALEESKTADAWPYPTAPGRVDYVRALAWWGLGRGDLAEEFYLRSYAADPDYIWAVADLAALYASSDEPVEQRKRRAAPWLTILKDRFRDDPAAPRLIARVERELQTTR